MKPSRTEQRTSSTDAVLYARVSSKEQEKEGFSIPAQTKLLRSYATTRGISVVREFVDVETAKHSGRTGFGEMLAFLRRSTSCRVILVEKTDRLYRNLRDWVTLDDLDLEIHFVKEGVVLSHDSRSSEKFIHGIKGHLALVRAAGLPQRRRAQRQEDYRARPGRGTDRREVVRAVCDGQLFRA